MSYDMTSLKYINDRFKDITSEYTSEEGPFFTKNTLTLVCCFQHMASHIILKKSVFTKIQKNV